VNPTTGSISGPRGIRQPQAGQGRSALVARDVRARPPADRPSSPGALGHRPGHLIRPGPELRYYVLDSANKAQYHRVTPVALEPDGLRVVEGLKPEDRVVVGGLQQVRPSMEIKPDPQPMPTLGPAAGSQKSEDRGQKSEAGGQK